MGEDHQSGIICFPEEHGFDRPLRSCLSGRSWCIRIVKQLPKTSCQQNPPGCQSHELTPTSKNPVYRRKFIFIRQRDYLLRKLYYSDPHSSVYFWKTIKLKSIQV